MPGADAFEKGGDTDTTVTPGPRMGHGSQRINLEYDNTHPSLTSARTFPT